MPDPRYTIDLLTLSGFRAYLDPRPFDFGSEQSLAVFAPNGKGKSSIVDALEFLFSDDGTLGRLGARAIHNNAGPTALIHNLAEERKITPHVAIRFRNGAEKLEGIRRATGKRTKPEAATQVQSHFVVEPIVRGHALRRFVEKETAEERYADVARWLRLGPLVDVQSNLRLLRMKTKATAEDTSRLQRLDSQLGRTTGKSVNAWDDAEVLAFANTLIEPLDKDLALATFDQGDPAFLTVLERAKAEAEVLGLAGLKQIRAAAASLYDTKKDPETDEVTVSGLLAEFSDMAAALIQAENDEASERGKAASTVFNKVWKASQPLFAEGAADIESCPVCDTPLADSKAGSKEGVREHLETHLAELADYAKAEKALSTAKAAASRLQPRLVAALKALIPLLPEDAKALTAELNAYLLKVEAWAGGVAPDAASLESKLADLMAKLDKSIEEIETKHGDSTYTKVQTKLEQLFEIKGERERAKRVSQELSKLSLALNEQAAFISGEIRKTLQSLLDTIQTPVNDIYREIQRADAAPVKLLLPPEDDKNQQRLNLVIDFAENRTDVQPSGYLSDSQIHSLALALRLAAIQQFNKAAPIIALDDIVTSYDADHRRSIAALLAKEFTDWQLLITTHDERFFIYLKDQLGQKGWHYTRITRLDPDFGPRFVDHRVTDEMIQAKWADGESAANEMRQAEEEWLLQICRDFGVSVKIRSVERAYSYERHELASALEKYLHDHNLTPPMIPGVNNRFLTSLQQGAVENFGSHFQDAPYGDGSIGDEKVRWEEFVRFRDLFKCPKCGKKRFKRPNGVSKPLCAAGNCEAQFAFN